MSPAPATDFSDEGAGLYASLTRRHRLVTSSSSKRAGQGSDLRGRNTKRYSRHVFDAVTCQLVHPAHHGGRIDDDANLRLRKLCHLEGDAVESRELHSGLGGRVPHRIECSLVEIAHEPKLPLCFIETHQAPDDQNDVHEHHGNQEHDPETKRPGLRGFPVVQRVGHHRNDDHQAYHFEEYGCRNCSKQIQIRIDDAILEIVRGHPAPSYIEPRRANLGRLGIASQCILYHTLFK